MEEISDLDLDGPARSHAAVSASNTPNTIDTDASESLSRSIANKLVAGAVLYLGTRGYTPRTRRTFCDGGQQRVCNVGKPAREDEMLSERNI